MQIYVSCGYTQKDASYKILKNNIYGLDIDKRAYQLSYFSIMMKARQYNRDIFNNNVEPNLCYIDSSKVIKLSALERLEEVKDVAIKLIDEFRYADEYGSLLKFSISYDDLIVIENKLNIIEKTKNIETLIDVLEYDDIFTILRPLIKQAKILVQKYEVVVTNPPYLKRSAVGPILYDYLKQYYPESKSDLFAAFIEKCNDMTIKNGFQAMITMHSWMFISSYEKLRKKILYKDLISMAHLGSRAFEEIGGEVVQTTAFVMRNSYLPQYKGVYCRLIDPNTQQGKEEMFLAKENRYISNQSNFSKIPGKPIAYWASKGIINIFSYGKSLGSIAITRNGMKTGNNDRFLRIWWEVDINKFNSSMNNYEEAKISLAKWFPYNKGGIYRKWYGNNDYVVNWENEGYEIFNNARIDKRNVQDYPKELKFVPSLSWSLITSNKISFRYKENNLSDIAGMSLFASRENIIRYLGLLNSKVALKILVLLAPTINFQSGDISRIPVLSEVNNNSNIISKVKINIELTKIDWDSFETSWDFTCHPLINGEITVEKSFEKWKLECNDRFNSLKENEEELNRIFINIYGLEEELTPEVSDKDITVTKVFNTKEDIYDDIKGNAY
ncbi:MAG: BREX-1 system adenine-specific DNA-methyltransferase PglX, partial [Erysipelotrichaceae bacterium]